MVRISNCTLTAPSGDVDARSTETVRVDFRLAPGDTRLPADVTVELLVGGDVVAQGTRGLNINDRRFSISGTTSFPRADPNVPVEVAITSVDEAPPPEPEPDPDPPSGPVDPDPGGPGGDPDPDPDPDPVPDPDPPSGPVDPSPGGPGGDPDPAPDPDPVPDPDPPSGPVDPSPGGPGGDPDPPGGPGGIGGDPPDPAPGPPQLPGPLPPIRGPPPGGGGGGGGGGGTPVISPGPGILSNQALAGAINRLFGGARTAAFYQGRRVETEDTPSTGRRTSGT